MYFPRSYNITGPPCESYEVGEYEENKIVIPEDRLAAHRNDPGGRYVLAHELAHTLGLRVHCNEGKENLCIEGDLMNSSVYGGGGNVSPWECRILGNYK